MDIHRYKDIRKICIKQTCRDVSFCLVFANLLLLEIPSDKKTTVIIVYIYIIVYKLFANFYVVTSYYKHSSFKAINHCYYRFVQSKVGYLN